MEQRLAKLSGFYYEFHYRERAPAYFGKIMRRARGHLPYELEELVEPYLSDDELYEFYKTDVVVQGRWRSDGNETYLVMEVSETVDANDVVRAMRRADLLKKAGMRVVPAIAGDTVIEEAQTLAQHERVLVVTDGRVDNVELVEAQWSN